MSALDRQVVIALGEQIAILKEENAALVRDLGQARAERGAAQRQAAASYARAEELREAAGALVEAITTSGGGYSCGTCYALATIGEPLPHGGYAFRCDRHASPPEKGWQDDPQEPRPTKVAAPLRALRALLGRVG